MKNVINNLAPKRLMPPLIFSFSLLIANINVLYASDNDIYQCATSKDVYDALDTVKLGDTIMLQGGKVYEIDKSFKLHANGSDKNRITFTSKDSTGQGRYAVISTVGQKKGSGFGSNQTKWLVLEHFPHRNNREESVSGQGVLEHAWFSYRFIFIRIGITP